MKSFTSISDHYFVEILSQEHLEHIKGGTIRDGAGGDIEKD